MKKRCFPFMVFFVSICCFAKGAQALEGNLHSNSVFHQHKIDQLVTNEQGVFLLVDGLWIGAQAVQATTSHILLLEEGEWMPLCEVFQCGTKFFWWKCPNQNCGRYNPHIVRHCLYCRTDRFS